MASLSKKLNPVARGWPTSLLVKDADKRSLGQSLTITMPHAIEGVPLQLASTFDAIYKHMALIPSFVEVIERFLLIKMI